jgi:uncharacterized protein (TIRG00374 family)
MSSKSRKWLLFALLALVIAFVIYRYRGAIHIGQIWRAVQSANPWYILGAVVLIYVCYFLRAVRWQNFQKYVGDSRLLPIFTMTMAGFSAVFLFGRVGEPVRPLLISRKDKVPIADTFGIYALERVLDLGFSWAVLACWFIVVTAEKYMNPAAASQTLEGVRKTAGTIVLVGVIGAVALFVYLRSHGAAMFGGRLEVWLAHHGWRAKVARIVLGVGRGLKTIRTFGDLAYAVGVSALHWFLIILVYYLVMLAFGGKLATLRFQDSMLILALTLVGSLFQLPGIGGGPQAVMVGAFTRFWGVSSDTAVAAAMVIYLITFAVVIFAGVPVLLKEGFSFGELRRMREHEDEEIDAEMIAHAPDAASTKRPPEPGPATGS